MRAVHDSRASDGENAPWRQDARAVYSSRTLCGAFWIHSTHILPKLAVFEYMAAICCREPVFFPSEAPSGTHQDDILPWPAERERIGPISCHGQAPDDRHRSSSAAYLGLQCGAGGEGSSAASGTQTDVAAWLPPYKCGFAQLGFFWTFMAPRSSSV